VFTTNEEKIHDLLVAIRQLVQKWTPETEAYRVGDYELASSLVSAAEAVISGLTDERVLLALDMLTERLEADLADLPEDDTPVASSPTGRSVLSA
jgi:hypothetical protein